MDYTTRIVRSVAGLSQEEALVTLQEHSAFRAGTKIASLSDQNGRWVAKLLEPRFAGEEELDMLTEKEEKKAEPKLNPFEKKEHDEHEMSESPKEEHEEHESPMKEKSEDKGGADKKIQELEKKIDKLLDALGIADDKALDGPMSDGAVPPPPAGDMAPPAPKAPKTPAGPPKGPELPPGSGAKLKPGEVPNKPGVTPIGSPAFASVRTANPGMNPPVPTPAGAAPAPGGVGNNPAMCAKCGGAGCDMCRPGQGASAPQNPPMAGAPVVSSFVASRVDSNRGISIRQAKISLDNDFASRGFRVARIKRDGDYLHALMTRYES